MMSEEATSQPILGTSQPAAASTGDGAMSTQPQGSFVVFNCRTLNIFEAHLDV